MAVRSTAALALDFPVSTPAKLRASVALFDRLVVDGFLGSKDELNQIQTALAAALVTEVYAAPGVAYTGAAGTAHCGYAVVPHYALPYAPGGSQNAAGKYLNFNGRPPYAAAATPAAAGLDGARRLYNPISAIAATNVAPNVFDANDYATITVPAAAGNIAGVQFDIICQFSVGGPFVLIARNLAPGAVYVDKGALTGEPNLYGAAYTPRAFAEVGSDASGPVYGPLTRL